MTELNKFKNQKQPYDITVLPNYNPALPFSGLTPEQQKEFESSSSNYTRNPAIASQNNRAYKFLDPNRINKNEFATAGEEGKERLMIFAPTAEALDQATNQFQGISRGGRIDPSLKDIKYISQTIDNSSSGFYEPGPHGSGTFNEWLNRLGPTGNATRQFNAAEGLVTPLKENSGYTSGVLAGAFPGNPAGGAFNTAQPGQSTQNGTQSTQAKSTTSFNWDGVNLKYGSRSDDVKELQEYLTGIGIMGSDGKPLKADGIYGPKTLEAVKQWQRDNGLVADGIVGPKTVSALNAVQGGQPVPDTAKAGYSSGGTGGGTGTSGTTGAGYTDERDSNGLLINPPGAKFDRNTGEPIPEVDDETKALEDAMATNPALKALYDQQAMILEEMKKKGQVVNPDLTIDGKLLEQFQTEIAGKLDPYYSELLRQNKENISLAFQTLQQDYDKYISREQPQFQNQLERQDIVEAESGTAFSSSRIKREGELIQEQQNRLDDMFQGNQRNIQDLAVAGERKLGSRDFSSLGIPSLSSYSAQRNTIAPRGQIASTGSRQLFNPIGDIEGSDPIAKRTAYAKEVENLKEQERKRRILDVGGLGQTVYG